jgi:hypothetical protein
MHRATMAAEVPAAPREFSLIAGGPFYRLARRRNLMAPSGLPRIWWFVGFAWLPLLVDTMVRAAVGAHLDPIVFDISVHVRFLVSLPLLAISARLVNASCRAAVLGLYESNLADRAELDRIIDGAERMRDNRWVEATLAVLAIVGGQLALWGVTGPTGLFAGIERAEASIARIWYTAIALPLLQFMLVRWLWHWVIWTTVLVRLSRLPLDTIATHPDRAAGLRVLSGPVTGFAGFELAFASTLASVWGTQLIDGRITVPALGPTLLLFVLIAFGVALGPLLLFTPHLYLAQRRALLTYNAFAFVYVRAFHQKWILNRGDTSPLGTSDIQSMADLGNFYGVIAGTGNFVISPRKLVELWLAAIVPMLPLIATVVPINEWLGRLGSALFGGFLP